MKIFVCEKCLKQFDHKTNYNSHINRKTDCKLTNYSGSKRPKK